MLQKFPEIAGIVKVAQVQFIRSRKTANETQVRRTQEVSQNSAESRHRSEALTGAALE